jgi:hypothetical protein
MNQGPSPVKSLRAALVAGDEEKALSIYCAGDYSAVVGAIILEPLLFFTVYLTNYFITPREGRKDFRRRSSSLDALSYQEVPARDPSTSCSGSSSRETY